MKTMGTWAIAPPILAEGANRGPGAKPSLAASGRAAAYEAASGLRFGTGHLSISPSSHHPNAQGSPDLGSRGHNSDILLKPALVHSFFSSCGGLRFLRMDSPRISMR